MSRQHLTSLLPCWACLLALSATLLMPAVASVRAEEPARPDPAAILRATARAYSGLRSFQVKVRTEIPLAADKPRLFQLPARRRDLNAAEPVSYLQSGVHVTEHEWRMLRDRALRLRIGFVNSRGACLSHLPDRYLHVGYDTGKSFAGSPLRPLRTWNSWDGKWRTGYYWGPATGAVHLDLPFRLSVTHPPDAVLAAYRVENLRSAQEGGRECHVLRLAVGHTIIPERWTRTNRKFGSATWTLWIDRETSLLWRAELQEQWEFGPQSRPEAVKPGVLEVRESYRDQLLNPDFRREDFLPEPPDPVQPAAPLPRRESNQGETPAQEEDSIDEPLARNPSPGPSPTGRGVTHAGDGAREPNTSAPKSLLSPWGRGRGRGSLLTVPRPYQEGGTAQGERTVPGTPPTAEPRGAVGAAAQGAAARWEPPAPMDRYTRYLLFPLRVHVLQSERYANVHSLLTDADVTRILGKVNQVWAQAGIQFYLESVRREPANDAHVNLAPPRQAADVLLDLRPRGSLAPRMFHLYYVRELPANGSSLQPDGVFVMDRARLRPVAGGIDEPIPRVTAHELGHRFTLGHPHDSTHLMASGTTGVRLSEAEIARARSAAQILGWGLSPAAALERARSAAWEERRGILRCLAAMPGPAGVRETAAARLRRAEQEER